MKTDVVLNKRTALMGLVVVVLSSLTDCVLNEHIEKCCHDKCGVQLRGWYKMRNYKTEKVRETK